MPSTTRVVAGVLAAATLAYSVVVAQRVLLGVLLASVVVLLGVLADGRLDSLRPARTTPGVVLVVALCALVLAYSLLIVQSFLFGLVVAAAVWASGVLVRHAGGRDALVEAVPGLHLAAGLLAAGVVLAYTLVVAQQVLLGVLAGVEVLGAAVATGLVR
jgi:hypothetical protein